MDTSLLEINPLVETDQGKIISSILRNNESEIPMRKISIRHTVIYSFTSGESEWIGCNTTLFR